MKRLGQHFLTNPAAIKKIIAALKPIRGETIIEVGAGHGELTFPLVHTPADIIAVERDPRLSSALAQEFKNQKSLRRQSYGASATKVKIIEGDILKILPLLVSRGIEKDKHYKLVGNLPYYISGHFLRLVGSLAPKPDASVFTLQREVAERIAAKPPRMNRLAASVQFWAEAKIVAHIPRKDFRPEPKVDSAVVRLRTRGNGFGVSTPAYDRMLRAVFAQPRKTVFNNLRSSGGDSARILEALRALRIAPRARPQDLAIGDLLALTRSFF